MKNLIFAVSLVCLGMSGAANAHLVSFGWKDNGNGTVTMWGQHWHGDQSAPSTANGGVRIGVFGTDESLWPVFQWTGHQNNIGGNTAENDLLVSSGILTGWAMEPSNWSNSSFENDWFYTDPLVIGNGTWGLFTGTNCCIDTMSAPREFTLTGITSIPVGTGPNNPNPIPEPGTIALLSVALLGMGMIRRRKEV